MKAKINGVELEGDANEMAMLLNQLKGNVKEVEQTRRTEMVKETLPISVAEKTIRRRRNQKNAWLPEEMTKLKELHELGYSDRQIAKELKGRTKMAVQRKRYVSGLIGYTRKTQEVDRFAQPVWNRRLKKVTRTIKRSDKPIAVTRAVKNAGIPYCGETINWFKEQLEDAHGIKKLANNKYCSSKLFKKLARNEVPELRNTAMARRLRKRKTSYQENPWHKFKRERMQHYAKSGMTFYDIMKQVSLEWERYKAGGRQVSVDKANTGTTGVNHDTESLIEDIYKRTTTSKNKIRNTIGLLMSNRKCSNEDAEIPESRWESVALAVITYAGKLEQALNLDKRIQLRNNILYLE